MAFVAIVGSLSEYLRTCVRILAIGSLSFYTTLSRTGCTGGMLIGPEIQSTPF